MDTLPDGQRPSADFSTAVALKADFDPAVGVEDDGNRVAVEEGFVQGVLALVNPLFLVLDTLATPRVAQPVGGRSNGQGVNDGNVCHIIASLAGRVWSHFTSDRGCCHYGKGISVVPAGGPGYNGADLLNASDKEGR